MLLFINLIVCSQEIQNPSFEGSYGMALTPQQWVPYGQASSPDTQPGAWRVTTEASHGNSYISMVCRGYSIFDSYLWEACAQRLTHPLESGKTYHYSIDLAFSETFKADTILFDRPAKLRVWGMNTSGQPKELLWESGAVSNTNWKTFYFDAKPTQLTEQLILEAYYTGLPKYCGNILIDNMQYYPEAPIIEEDSIPEFVEEPDVVVDPDFDVKVDENGIPFEINERHVTQGRELAFTGNYITITVWDNQTVDGDIVSLFLNEKNVLKEYAISKEKYKVEVEVEDGKTYYLTLYAHNLGEIPPNTVSLVVSDGKHKKFVRLSSNLKACSAAKIKIGQELVDNF